MFKPSHLFRGFLLTVSLVFFATNVALPYFPETSFWKERKKSLQVAGLPSVPSPLPSNRVRSSAKGNFRSPFKDIGFAGRVKKNEELRNLLKSIPAHLGSIRKISSPKKSKRIVLHIQDVHMNGEAQENIGRTIQSLIDQNQIGLLALEGAFEPIDLSDFRKFPHKDTIHKVADYLLREHKISGPVHTAFTSAMDIPPLIGVDDPQHYQANVEAYQQSEQLIDSTKDRIDGIRMEVEEEKRKTFNKDLHAFDQRVAAYQRGELELGDHVLTLRSKNTQPFKSLDTFLEALRLEESLNFTQVESQRAHLLSQLLNNLSKDESANLIDVSVAYRSGRVNHASFYNTLKNMCAKNSVDLIGFKHLNDYIRYVLLSDQIDTEKFLNEMRSLEKKVYSSLIQTVEERQLIGKSRNLYLASKLANFSLTSEEWAEYKKTLPSSEFQVPRSFKAFYEEANARDITITRNLLKSMESHNAKVAVLVTGGFHSKGINRVLKNKGITTLTFVPKITKVDTEEGSQYLSVFTQEKSPLDQLFEGDKLFLARKPMVDLATAKAFVITKFLQFRKKATTFSHQIGNLVWHILINPQTREIKTTWVTTVLIGAGVTGILSALYQWDALFWQIPLVVTIFIVLFTLRRKIESLPIPVGVRQLIAVKNIGGTATGWTIDWDNLGSLFSNWSFMTKNGKDSSNSTGQRSKTTDYQSRYFEYIGEKKGSLYTRALEYFELIETNPYLSQMAERILSLNPFSDSRIRISWETNDSPKVSGNNKVQYMFDEDGNYLGFEGIHLALGNSVNEDDPFLALVSALVLTQYTGEFFSRGTKSRNYYEKYLTTGYPEWVLRSRLWRMAPHIPILKKYPETILSQLFTEFYNFGYTEDPDRTSKLLYIADRDLPLATALYASRESLFQNYSDPEKFKALDKTWVWLEQEQARGTDIDWDEIYERISAVGPLHPMSEFNAILGYDPSNSDEIDALFRQGRQRVLAEKKRFIENAHIHYGVGPLKDSQQRIDLYNQVDSVFIQPDLEVQATKFRELPADVTQLTEGTMATFKAFVLDNEIEDGTQHLLTQEAYSSLLISIHPYNEVIDSDFLFDPEFAPYYLQHDATLIRLHQAHKRGLVPPQKGPNKPPILGVPANGVVVVLHDPHPDMYAEEKTAIKGIHSATWGREILHRGLADAVIVVNQLDTALFTKKLLSEGAITGLGLAPIEISQIIRSARFIYTTYDLDTLSLGKHGMLPRWSAHDPDDLWHIKALGIGKEIDKAIQVYKDAGVVPDMMDIAISPSYLDKHKATEQWINVAIGEIQKRFSDYREQNRSASTHHLPLYIWKPFKHALTEVFLGNNDFPDDVFYRLVRDGLGMARLDQQGQIHIEKEALPILTRVLNQVLGRAPPNLLNESDVQKYLEIHENHHKSLRQVPSVIPALQDKLKDSSLYDPDSVVPDYNTLKILFANNYGKEFLNDLEFVEELLVVFWTEQEMLDQNVRLVLDKDNPKSSRIELPHKIATLLLNTRIVTQETVSPAEQSSDPISNDVPAELQTFYNRVKDAYSRGNLARMGNLLRELPGGYEEDPRPAVETILTRLEVFNFYHLLKAFMVQPSPANERFFLKKILTIAPSIFNSAAEIDPLISNDIYLSFEMVLMRLAQRGVLSEGEIRRIVNKSEYRIPKGSRRLMLLWASIVEYERIQKAKYSEELIEAQDPGTTISLGKAFVYTGLTFGTPADQWIDWEIEKIILIDMASYLLEIIIETDEEVIIFEIHDEINDIFEHIQGEFLDEAKDEIFQPDDNPNLMDILERIDEGFRIYASATEEIGLAETEDTLVFLFQRIIEDVDKLLGALEPVTIPDVDELPTNIENAHIAIGSYEGEDNPFPSIQYELSIEGPYTIKEVYGEFLYKIQQAVNSVKNPQRENPPKVEITIRVEMDENTTSGHIDLDWLYKDNLPSVNVLEELRLIFEKYFPGYSINANHITGAGGAIGFFRNFEDVDFLLKPESSDVAIQKRIGANDRTVVKKILDETHRLHKMDQQIPTNFAYGIDRMDLQGKVSAPLGTSPTVKGNRHGLAVIPLLIALTVLGVMFFGLPTLLQSGWIQWKWIFYSAMFFLLAFAGIVDSNTILERPERSKKRHGAISKELDGFLDRFSKLIDDPRTSLSRKRSELYQKLNEDIEGKLTIDGQAIFTDTKGEISKVYKDSKNRLDRNFQVLYLLGIYLWDLGPEYFNESQLERIETEIIEKLRHKTSGDHYLFGFYHSLTLPSLLNLVLSPQTSGKAFDRFRKLIRDRPKHFPGHMGDRIVTVVLKIGWRHIRNDFQSSIDAHDLEYIAANLKVALSRWRKGKENSYRKKQMEWAIGNIIFGFGPNMGIKNFPEYWEYFWSHDTGDEEVSLHFDIRKFRDKIVNLISHEDGDGIVFNSEIKGIITRTVKQVVENPYRDLMDVGKNFFHEMFNPIVLPKTDHGITFEDVFINLDPSGEAAAMARTISTNMDQPIANLDDIVAEIVPVFELIGMKDAMKTIFPKKRLKSDRKGLANIHLIFVLVVFGLMFLGLPPLLQSNWIQWEWVILLGLIFIPALIYSRRDKTVHTQNPGITAKGQALSDYLGKPIQLGVGRKFAADTLILSRSITPEQIPSILESLSQRTTVIFTETDQLALEFQTGIVPNHVVVRSLGETNSLDTDSDQINLAAVETYLKTSDRVPQEVRNLFRRNPRVNVITSDDLPELNYDNLRRNSFFLKNGTVYLVIDKLLKILRSHQAPKIRTIIQGFKAVLQAA